MFINEKGRKALEGVAEWLESGAPHVTIDADTNLVIDHFNMEYSIDADYEHHVENYYVEDSCGTACCIAGAVVQFEKMCMDSRNNRGEVEWHIVEDAVITEFDMDTNRAMELFLPWEYFDLPDYLYNNPKVASKVIRTYLATGQVDWDAAAREYCESQEKEGNVSE